MGFYIHIALLTLALILLSTYQKALVRTIRKIPAHSLVLYVVTAVPLVVFEEQINCQPSWCGNVLIPPTLLFILCELLVLYVVHKKWGAKNMIRTICFFCAYGVLFELIVGGLRGAYRISPLLIFMIFWVALSYYFIAALPLAILEEK